MYQRPDYAVMVLFHQDGGDGVGQRIRNPVIRPLVLHEVAVVGVEETFDTGISKTVEWYLNDV